MPTHYRSVRPEEIPAAMDVFLTALADLARRNGFAPPKHYTHASVEPLFRHLFATGLFEVAEADGRIVSIASGIVRDRIWFLSMFWTLPEFQRQGIGRPLLERVFVESRQRGAELGCTCSSVDYAAIGLYLKLGLMPGGPIFTFAGPITAGGHDDRAATVQPLDPANAHTIDRVVRGTAREQDHAFWRARGVPAFQLEREGRVAAYFYVNEGAVGPAAWLHRDDGPALLACAIREAGKLAPEVRLMVTGTNQDAIRTATRAGLRIVGTTHWLRSAAFGVLEQYLPSGPALF
jgi:ribosomal protein S18 acetylase RimI-like enzyme